MQLTAQIRFLVTGTEEEAIELAINLLPGITQAEPRFLEEVAQALEHAFFQPVVRQVGVAHQEVVAR